MEFTFVLLVAAGAVLGFVLRGVVSPMVMRAFAVAGVLGLALGIGLLGLTASGRSPFDTLTAGLIAAVWLGLAGLLLPFALVVRWSRL
jgi:hypothetical protein